MKSLAIHFTYQKENYFLVFFPLMILTIPFLCFRML